jgi:hypothetical protein
MSSVALAQQENAPQKNSDDVAKAVVDDASKTTTAATPNQPVGPAEPKTETKGSTPPAPATDSDGWHFEMTPYVWLAGLEGNLRVRNNTVRIDSSPSDLLKQLDFAFATQFEAGKGKFKFILDENYVNLGTTGVGPLGQSTDVQPTLNIFEFGGSYAPVVVSNKNSTSSTPLPPTFSLEIIGGGRYTHFGLGLDRPNFNAEGSRNIVDAFIGNRVKVRPHPAVTLIGKYTVGGGGSHFAWTAAGLVDLRWKPSFSVWGGYQVLDMDADQASNTIGFNGRMRGVIVGFTMYR